jgi:hypothetical protein
MSPSREVCCSQCANQVGLAPLAGLPPVDALVVGACAGVAGLPLQVVEARPDGLHDHRVHLGDQARPIVLPHLVPRLACQAGVLPEGGIEDRDRLRHRQGQVEEQRALPRLTGGLQPEFAFPLGGRVRLGGQQTRVDVRSFPASAERPAQLRAVEGLAPLEQQVVRFPLDDLAGFEAERFRGRAPPAAGRLAAALAGMDVIPGRIPRQGAVDLFPDVVKVITLAQGPNNRQTLCLRTPEATELTISIRWCMGDALEAHTSMVTNPASKIRNETKHRAMYGNGAGWTDGTD